MIKLTTETRVPPEQWIDRLSPSDALAVMLDNQAGAIDAIRAALPQIEHAVDGLYQRLGHKTGRLLYCGAGTSARIAVQDGAELLPTFNWPQSRIGYLIAGGMGALTMPVEGAEDSETDAHAQCRAMAIDRDDCIIGLAASGGTRFTCSVLEAANQAGALTIGISNNPDTDLLNIAEYPILLHTGAEALAGSTRLKAGTAQKICLNLISTQLMVRLGYVTDGLMSEMVPANEKLRRRKAEIDALLAPENS